MNQVRAYINKVVEMRFMCNMCTFNECFSFKLHGDPENLLHNSFYQFQAYQSIICLFCNTAFKMKYLMYCFLQIIVCLFCNLVSTQYTMYGRPPLFSIHEEVTWELIINFERVKVVLKGRKWKGDSGKQKEKLRYVFFFFGF